MANKTHDSTLKPWQPGQRQIDIRDLQPDSVIGRSTMPVGEVIGVMDAAALTADLCLYNIIKAARQ